MTELEHEIEKYFECWLQGASDEGCFNPQSQLVSIYDCHRIARHFANWQKEQLTKEAIPAKVARESYSSTGRQGVLMSDYIDLDKHSLALGDETKIIIVEKGQ